MQKTSYDYESVKKLCDFWKKENFHRDTKIHNGDYDYLKEKNLLVENCKSFEDYVEKYLNEPADKKFHQNLIPCPYVGDLKNSKIYILSLNPGFGNDYYFERDSEFRSALEGNLSQKFYDNDYPFLYLNPRFLGTGGGSYWLKKLSPVINHLKTKMKFTDALSFLAKNICLLEIVPYHSKSFGFSKYIKLPSVNKMISFLKNYVIPKAEKNDAALIVLRKGKELKDLGVLPKKTTRNVLIYPPNYSQNPCLSIKAKNKNEAKYENVEGGRFILEFLKVI